jgi:hypothetical protein
MITYEEKIPERRDMKKKFKNDGKILMIKLNSRMMDKKKKKFK